MVGRAARLRPPIREVLTRRRLNRALLARQMLLERAAIVPLQAIERLAGIQSQLPLSAYVALWSRLAAFEPQDLAALIEARQALRTVLMRSTVHLVSAADCLAFRPVLADFLARAFRTASPFGARLGPIDMEALVARGRAHLDRAPLTLAELAGRLSADWPDRDPESLAQAIRSHAPLIQVPPRGLWGKSGLPRLATAESWLRRPLASQTVPDDLVRRYLAAFGPATIRDAQAWSGLPRLDDAFARLGDELAVFADERGNALYDLADAPRPSEAARVPVRFLSEYDNMLVAYADRGRIIPPEHLKRVATSLGRPTVLIDGFVAGLWKVDGKGAKARLTVAPFRRPSQRLAASLAAEGRRLLAFVAPEADPGAVRIESGSAGP